MGDKNSNLPRLMIVGTGSGCGKTTITTALLKALTIKGKKPVAFKCGPDYIDPMFHKQALGIDSHNLDGYLMGFDAVRRVLSYYGSKGDVAIIEGVMGMYDGKTFEDDSYSANHISLETSTPAILVVNVKGVAHSILATITGFINLHENKLKGVILNNCSRMMYPTYKNTIEQSLDIKVLGYMEHVSQAEISSRHLGLKMTHEYTDMDNRLKCLGMNAIESLDIDEILAVASAAENVKIESAPVLHTSYKGINLAVAYDEAFNFYYSSAIDLLENSGCNITYFSPLKDKYIPADMDGIIFGGGYPELFADKLSSNQSMIHSIRTAHEAAMPIFAECGGFMYLGKEITVNENSYKMVDLLPSVFKMENRLDRFGYKEVVAKDVNPLFSTDKAAKCHEFHYSSTNDYGNILLARKGKRSWDMGFYSNRLFASYGHFHFVGEKQIAQGFLDLCQQYKKERNNKEKGQ